MTYARTRESLFIIKFKNISKKEHRKNWEIRVPEVFLIDDSGVKVGVMPTRDAIARAQAAGLDLVEVAPQARPPVVKIINYGKLLYEQEKQERKNKAKSKKGGEVKGVRLSIKMSDHDFMVRVNTGQKFLDSGNKIKIDLLMRGRERAHPELAHEVIKRYIGSLERVTNLEQPISRMGGRLSAMIALKK